MVEHQPVIGWAAVFGKVVNVQQQVAALGRQNLQRAGKSQVLSQAVVVNMPDIRFRTQDVLCLLLHFLCQFSRGNRGPDRLILQTGNDPVVLGPLHSRRFTGEHGQGNTSV